MCIQVFQMYMIREKIKILNFQINSWKYANSDAQQNSKFHDSYLAKKKKESKIELRENSHVYLEVLSFCYSIELSFFLNITFKGG